MKKFKCYEETKSLTEQRKLPSGGYLLKILQAEEIIYSWGSVLKFDFDILEGEYQDFYKINYESQVQEDKKWKGTYRLPVPKDDGSEKDSWTKAKFKTVMEAFEKSNKGFVWNWDESGLIGKIIGGLFNQKEWEYDGKSGWYTQCAKLVDVQLIKDGSFIIPKDQPMKREPTQAASLDENEYIPVNEILPF